MLRKRLRKLLRRLVIWALNPMPAILIKADIEIDRGRAEEIFIRGGSTREGRNVIVKQIRQAQRSREL